MDIVYCFTMDDYDFYSEALFSDYTPNTPATKTHLAIHEHYDYDETRESNMPHYITYEEDSTYTKSLHKENEAEEEKEEEEEKDNNKLNLLSQFYFGSLTIIGLFIVFRILRLKK